MKKRMMAMVLLLFLCTGCSKLNQENYNKIETGDDYSTITKLIGEPDKCDAVVGIKQCVWGNESKNITVKFVADKVIFRSMKGL